MSLDQLRYFVAVADCGTTRAAARRMHVSQPPLSRQIQALENELGVKLFARTARGMELAPAGQRFLETARSILLTLEDAVSQIRRTREDDPVGWSDSVPRSSVSPLRDGSSPETNPDQ